MIHYVSTRTLNLAHTYIHIQLSGRISNAAGVTHIRTTDVTIIKNIITIKCDIA